MTWLFVAVAILVAWWNVDAIVKKTAKLLRALPESAATERILDADEVREVEHKLGIGPFAGRENYCDLTKCTSQNHTHDDVDKETMTGKAVPKPPRPTHILMPAWDEAPVAKSYTPGQLPDPTPVLSTKAVPLDELTVDHATRLMMAGILPRSVLADLLGEPWMGHPNEVEINPNFTKWNSRAALDRADRLAQEGRPPNGYCVGLGHDHALVQNMRGDVFRRCEN